MSAALISKPTPLTSPYWEGTRAGVLRMQRCHACERHFFYPRPACRYCRSTDWEWQDLSGRGTLASFVINARPLLFESAGAQIIALVDLEEGPRMATNLVKVAPDPEVLRRGMPLHVEFEQRGEQMLPVFAPSEMAAA